MQVMQNQTEVFSRDATLLSSLTPVNFPTLILLHTAKANTNKQAELPLTREEQAICDMATD